MKKLYLTIIFSLSLLPLILIRDSLSCAPSAPLYTHFVYMFAHASLLHWTANTWSMVVFHNLFNPHRLLAAYVFSVLASFLPLSIGEVKPVLGLSVIVCFFLGMSARWLYHNSKLALCLSLATVIISCFLPGFAGGYHVIMFVIGTLYFHVECFIKRIRQYA